MKAVCIYKNVASSKKVIHIGKLNTKHKIILLHESNANRKNKKNTKMKYFLFH